MRLCIHRFETTWTTKPTYLIGHKLLFCVAYTPVAVNENAHCSRAERH